MPQRDPSIPLGHMLDAIKGIESATSDIDFETYCSTWIIKHAVQRGIEIISEASRHLPSELTSQQPDIPWPKVRSIGNILRHEYHNIEDEVIWKLVQNDLAPLRDAVQTLLEELDENSA
ncbi:MAG: HepT-like ribonuclease domain-containing protein [Pseudomonadota bacterium]